MVFMGMDQEGYSGQAGRAGLESPRVDKMVEVRCAC
jgi:hypothetical protein